MSFNIKQIFSGLLSARLIHSLNRIWECWTFQSKLSWDDMWKMRAESWKPKDERWKMKDERWKMKMKDDENCDDF
jgi:hypothetical protein